MSETSKDARVYVAGHLGMVGSNLVRRMQAGDCTRLLTHSRAKHNRRAVHALLAAERPDCIFIAAARVGGIQANSLYRADFMYENPQIQNSLIHGAHVAGVQRNSMVKLAGFNAYGYHE